MTGRMAPARARRQHGHGVRGAVAAAVAAVHHSRPPAGATAGEQAVWWHRTASALDLIAEHEADAGRAESARAEAATARRLSQGLGLAHTAEATAAPPVAEIEDAAVDEVPELATDIEVDELEVSWP